MSGIAVSKGLRLPPTGLPATSYRLPAAVLLPHFGMDAPRGGTKVHSKQCKNTKNALNPIFLTTLQPPQWNQDFTGKHGFLRGD